MKTLSGPERDAVSSREAQFDTFYSELMPALVEFVEQMGITPAHGVLVDATAYAGPLGTVLRGVRVESADDRVWLVSRLGYFIGEYCARTHGGCWFVDDDPDSPSFARFVVGQFTTLGEPPARVDPFEAAAAYVDALPGADLESRLADLDAALATAAGRVGSGSA